MFFLRYLPEVREYPEGGGEDELGSCPRKDVLHVEAGLDHACDGGEVGSSVCKLHSLWSRRSLITVSPNPPS